MITDKLKIFISECCDIYCRYVLGNITFLIDSGKLFYFIVFQEVV